MRLAVFVTSSYFKNFTIVYLLCVIVGLKIKEKNLSRLRVAVLEAEKNYGWLHDVKNVLKGRELLKSVVLNSSRPSMPSPSDLASSPENGVNLTASGNAELSQLDAQKCNLSLAYIVTSVDRSWRVLVRQLRGKKKVWKTSP